jgi:hypothetical protein
VKEEEVEQKWKEQASGGDRVRLVAFLELNERTKGTVMKASVRSEELRAEEHSMSRK